MVWQPRCIGAKSPRVACAGSTPVASAKVSVVRSSDSTGGCQRSSLTAGNPGPVAQRNKNATLRRSRSHVQIVPGPPLKNSYGVAELERRESLELVYVGSNPTSVASFEKVDAEYTGVVRYHSTLSIANCRFPIDVFRNRPLLRE